MTRASAALQAALLSVSSASLAFGQGMPTSQPSLISIVREEVKTGHNAMHSAYEAGWPAAFARAKSPNFYLAMVAITDPNEAWYITPYATNAALGESMKLESDNKALSADLARLQKGDAAYAAAAKRAAPNMSWRTYEVIAGLPGPAYFVFSSVQSFAEFDRAAQDGMALGKAFTPEELQMMEKFGSSGLINAETQRFRLDPVQSYVDAATKAKDWKFWSPGGNP